MLCLRYHLLSMILLIYFSNVHEVYPTRVCNSTNFNFTTGKVNISGGNGTNVCSGDNQTSTQDSNQSGGNEGRTVRIIAMTVDAVGVLCNTLLIIAILVDPLNVLRRGAWLTILNLSIADLIAAVSNFMTIGLQTEFKRNSIARPVFSFFWMFGVSGSFMLLTLLTIETYIIVKYPIRSRLMISGKKIGLSCAAIWILAILLGLSNVPHHLDSDLKPTQVMMIYIAQIAVLELVVVVQVILKVLIIREIMKSRLNAEVNAEHRNNKHKEIAKTIVILNVILIVTALPYFVAKQMEYLWRVDVLRDNLLGHFANIYEPIAVLNFALNPVLYSLRLSDYRRSLLAFLCQCRHKGRLRSESSRSMKTATTVQSRSSFRAVDQEATNL